MKTYATKGMVGVEFLLLIGDLTELDFGCSTDNWQYGSAVLGGNFAFLFGGLALAQLPLLMDWEQDQLAAVFLEALDVLLLRLNGLVAATSVDGNTDGLSKASGQTSSLRKIENKRQMLKLCSFHRS